jgi:hypothetical protein
MKMKLVSSHEVLATERIRLHLHPPDQACSGMCADFREWTELGCRGEAAYLVDLRTGETKGRIGGESDLVQVDPVWWEEHCARVGARVREEFRDHVVR